MARRRKHSRYGSRFLIAVLITGILLECAGIVIRMNWRTEDPLVAEASNLELPFVALKEGTAEEAEMEDEDEGESWDEADDEGIFDDEETEDSFDDEEDSAADEVSDETQPPVETAEVYAETSTLQPTLPPLDELPSETEDEATEAPTAAQTNTAAVESTPTPTAAPTEIQVTPTPEPTAEPSKKPTPSPEPTIVPESFFNKTLFIGDSKTNGLQVYARLGKAMYYCGTSYSVYNILKKRTSDGKNFKNATLKSVLKKYKYDQVYIMLGYNECGYDFNNLMKQFKTIISLVHKSQPEAKIIIHAVMHANKRVSKKYSYYSVANIDKVNAGLKKLTKKAKYLYFVDCNDAFCDKNGYLLDKVSNDGEHLTPEYTKVWAQEIRKRAILD